MAGGNIPQFYIVDGDGNVMFANEGSGIDLEARRALPGLLAHVRESADGSATVSLSSTVLLRAGTIRGTGGIWHAVFGKSFASER